MLILLMAWHFSQVLYWYSSGIIALHFDWVQRFLVGGAKSIFVGGCIWVGGSPNWVHCVQRFSVYKVT